MTICNIVHLSIISTTVHCNIWRCGSEQNSVFSTAIHTSMNCCSPAVMQYNCILVYCGNLFSPVPQLCRQFALEELFFFREFWLLQLKYFQLLLGHSHWSPNYVSVYRLWWPGGGSLSAHVKTALFFLLFISVNFVDFVLVTNLLIHLVIYIFQEPD